MRSYEFQLRSSTKLPDTELDISVLEMAVLMQGLAIHATILNEATMTPDQIQGLFGEIEKKMVDDKTTAGKVAGAAGKGLKATAKGLKTINDVKDRLIQAASNTKAVAGFDNLADKYLGQLKKALGGKFPKVVEGFEKYAEWAKKNPVKQGLIIAALTAAASLAAAPSVAGYGAVLGASSFVTSAGVGSAVGFILRTLNSLLKGEKLSTALFKGAAGGLVGYLAGMGIKELAEMFGDPAVDDFMAVTDAGKKDVILSSFREAITLNYTDPETGKEMLKDYFLDVMGTPDEIEKLKDTFEGISDAMRDGDTDQATSLLRSVAKQNFLDYEGEDIPGLLVNINDDSKQQALSWAGKFVGKELADVTSFNGEIEKLQAEFRDKVVAVANGIQAAAQGAAAGATRGKTAASESHMMSEADIKGAIGKVGAWAAKQGNEVMQKYTAKKLAKLWQEAGSPTDSAAVHNILLKAGIPEDVLKTTFKELKVPVPAKPRSSKPKAQTPAAPAIKTGNDELDAKVNEILASKGKDAALQFLMDLKQKSQATVQTKGVVGNAKHGAVRRASDGQEYRLDIGKNGDRIWLNTKTGNEATASIDDELEKQQPAKPKKKATSASPASGAPPMPTPKSAGAT